MTWPKPSRFSEEAMTDRLVQEHERGEHLWPITGCPPCEKEARELLEDDTDEPEDA